jgi:hypothetical protein
VWVILQNEAIDIGARVSLVRVCDDKLWLSYLLAYGAPFLARGKCGPAATAKTGQFKFSYYFLRQLAQGHIKCLVPPAISIVFHASRFALDHTSQDDGAGGADFDLGRGICGARSRCKVAFAQAIDGWNLNAGSVPPVVVEMPRGKACHAPAQDFGWAFSAEMVEGSPL